MLPAPSASPTLSPVRSRAAQPTSRPAAERRERTPARSSSCSSADELGAPRRRRRGRGRGRVAAFVQPRTRSGPPGVPGIGTARRLQPELPREVRERGCRRATRPSARESGRRHGRALRRSLATRGARQRLALGRNHQVGTDLVGAREERHGRSPEAVAGATRSWLGNPSGRTRSRVRSRVCQATLQARAYARRAGAARPRVEQGQMTLAFTDGQAIRGASRSARIVPRSMDLRKAPARDAKTSDSERTIASKSHPREPSPRRVAP